MYVIAGRLTMSPRFFVCFLFFCLIGALSAQTSIDSTSPEFPVNSELYALMTDHLGVDTGPESICGIGSMIGRPFVATRVVTSLQRDPVFSEDNPEPPHRYVIARDRFGRVRCEIGYLMPDFGPVHNRVKLGTYVYDPVEQTHTSMYPESFHSAFLIPFDLMDPIFAKGSPIFSFCVLAAAEDSHCLRKFRESWRDKVVKSEELGNHSVNGLDAAGYMAVLESGDAPETKELLSTLEEWVSIDDKILLRKSSRVGESFTRTLAVTDLRFEEPPVSLFEVPQGDRVHQVSSLPEQLLGSH
jgi:hypothetical protein